MSLLCMVSKITNKKNWTVHIKFETTNLKSGIYFIGVSALLLHGNLFMLLYLYFISLTGGKKMSYFKQTGKV